MLKGSCLCTGVAYRADGPVEDASHCYCTICRKQHAAAAGSYANVPSAGFAIERGASLVTEYASSEQVRRGFCRVCGSTLYSRNLREPDIISVTLGTLDPGYDAPVEREIYTDTKPGWLPTA